MLDVLVTCIAPYSSHTPKRPSALSKFANNDVPTDGHPIQSVFEFFNQNNTLLRGSSVRLTAESSKSVSCVIVVLI